MQSIANAVAPCAWSCAIRSSFCAGWIIESSVRSPSFFASSGVGGAIFVTTSAAHASAASTTEAPAAAYLSRASRVH